MHTFQSLADLLDRQQGIPRQQSIRGVHPLQPGLKHRQEDLISRQIDTITPQLRCAHKVLEIPRPQSVILIVRVSLSSVDESVKLVLGLLEDRLRFGDETGD